MMAGMMSRATGTLMTTAVSDNGNNQTPGQTATGSTQFNADGTITGSDHTGPTSWVTGKTGLWSIRVTVTAGAFASGTTGVWLTMDVARLYTRSGTTGTGSVTYTIEFSPDNGATISGTVTGNIISFSHAPP